MISEIDIKDMAEQPAQQQEPVAWMWRCKPYCDWPEWSVSLKRPADSGRDGHKRTEGYEDVPLYTSPPQRTWVGLTDEQIKTRTDEQIEATFKRCGGRWNGDHWVIEDADLHPFVRTIEGADLNTLRAISDEYNAWIKHHAAGHSYDDFLAKSEAAHGIRGEA